MTLTNAQNALLAKKSDIPFFADLTNEEVLTVAKDVVFLRPKKGEIIFEQGDSGDAIYYIVKGSVGVVIKRADQDGNDEFVEVTTLPRKSFFGEMAFITNEPRSARIVCSEEDTAILTFSILNDVDQEDKATIRALALVYFYFAQDLAGKLKVTSANYAKIKTVDNIPYDEIVENLKTFAKTLTGTETVINIDEDETSKVEQFFPAAYDQESKREIIKTAVSEAFELSNKDLIIFARNRIVVRIFQDIEVPITDPLAQLLSDPETRNYINSLFSESAVFEQEVLKVETIEQKERFFEKSISEILDKMSFKKYLSFHHIESYNHFKLSRAVDALERFIFGVARIYLNRDCELNLDQTNAILERNISKEFIKKLALWYVKFFKHILTQKIADSFVEIVAKTEDPSLAPRAIIEAINGTGYYISILSKEGGGMVANQVAQIKMRLDQAARNKAKVSAELHSELEEIEARVQTYRKNLDAIELASMLGKASIENYDHKLLRDIVIDEEGKYTEQKRIFKFMPASELTLYLKNTADRGITSATNEVQRAEFKRTYKFFDSIHTNNTESALNLKKSEIKEMLPKLEASQKRVADQVTSFDARRLENFDEGLKKIYEAITYSLGRKKA